MKYEEAVSRAQDWLWRAYPEGYVTDKNKEALAVLRSVGPLVEAVENTDKHKHQTAATHPAVIDWWAADVLEAALSLKNGEEKTNAHLRPAL